MKKEKYPVVLASLLLPLFLLLFSYSLVLELYPVTAEQQRVLQYLAGKEALPLNYTAAEQAHLGDVAEVMSKAKAIFYLSFLGLAALFIYSSKSRELLQKMLHYGGLSSLGCLFLLLVGISFGFSRAFALFHQVFFPQGNWMFAADSLLIRTFPAEFFVKISTAIFILAFILGSLFILLSVYLKHGHTNKWN